MFARKLQLLVLCRATDRKDGGESPIRDAFVDEERLELRQGVVVVLMYHSHHVIDERRVAHYHVDCLTGHAEAVGMATQPGVLFFQSVEADCHGAESGILQFLKEFGREEEPVRHHSPWEPAC